MLDEGSPDISSITDLLGQSITALSSLCRVDKSQQKLMDQAENAAAILEDISHELRSYLEQLEYNPRRLEQIEIRLDLITNLIKKYGGSIEAINKFLKTAKLDIDSITHASERIEELEAEEKILLEDLKTKGLLLSEQRQTAGNLMGIAVEKRTCRLSMPGAKFIVDIQHVPR